MNNEYNINTDAALLDKTARKMFNKLYRRGFEPYQVIMIIGGLLVITLEEMGLNSDESQGFVTQLIDNISEWVENHGNDTLQNDQGTTE